MTFMFLEFSFLVKKGGSIASLKKFGDQAIAVEEENSGAVEPANLPKDWCRTRSRSDRELKFAVPTLSWEFEFARDQDR